MSKFKKSRKIESEGGYREHYNWHFKIREGEDCKCRGEVDDKYKRYEYCKDWTKNGKPWCYTYGHTNCGTHYVNSKGEKVKRDLNGKDEKRCNPDEVKKHRDEAYKCDYKDTKYGYCKKWGSDKDAFCLTKGKYTDYYSTYYHRWYKKCTDKEVEEDKKIMAPIIAEAK